MSEFQGQVVIITGAAGNLGRACAAAFDAWGATSVLVDISEQALAGAHPDVPAERRLAADLTRADSVAMMVATVMERFGRVDVLANVAGGFRMGPPLQDTPEADWDFMLDLNARSVFLSCKSVVPHMLAAGAGRIVNVAARAAVQAKGHMAPYCASKAAVVTLTESLALELKQQGITVNCILPGTVDTPQNRADMPGADHGTWVPTGALADVIRFLASDAARAVTGAAVPVYGRS